MAAKKDRDMDQRYDEGKAKELINIKKLKLIRNKGVRFIHPYEIIVNDNFPLKSI